MRVETEEGCTKYKLFGVFLMALAYSITLTNGQLLTVVAPNTVDDTTSIRLVGHDFVEYGGIMENNFIHQLENFASTTPPPHPLIGQLWYDTTHPIFTDRLLKIWNGHSWQIIFADSSSTPNVFTFTRVTNAALSTLLTSNTITVSGLGTDISVPVSITGGAYSQNGLSYVTTTGTALNGDTFAVQATSSADNATPVNVTLSLGTINSTYTITTLPLVVDTTPDPFVFTNATNVALSTLSTSNMITVSGLDTGVAAPVSILGGAYSLNGAPYVTWSQTAVNGDTFTVQAISSASNSTAVNATLTIGTVSETFAITTTGVVSDIIPDQFSFIDVSSVALSTLSTSNTITVAGLSTGISVPVSVAGGLYKKNTGTFIGTAGTAANGDTFAVQATSSSSNSTSVNVTLTIGGVTDTYTITTLSLGSEASPSPFTFVNVSNAALSTLSTSNTITVGGLGTGISVTVSIVGATYSKNGGAFVGTTGTATNGDTFAVRLTSSSSNSTSINGTLTIGGGIGTYSVTTVALGVNSTPNQFSFIDVTNAALSTLSTSNTITVGGLSTGISVPVTISAVGTGAAYSKNGGAYLSSSGTATNGDTFSVRATSSFSNSTAVSVTLTIGGVSDTYAVTTLALVLDTTPNQFTFTDVVNAPINTVMTSNTITVAGLSTGTSVPVSVTPWQYSKNGGAFTAAAGTAVNGDTFAVHLTSGVAGSFLFVTLTIGGVSDTYSVTAIANDTTPDAFSFPDTSFPYLTAQVGPPTTNFGGILSNFMVSGLGSAGAPISISGGLNPRYAIGFGQFTNVAGTVHNGDIIGITSQMASSVVGSITFTTLTIGTFSATWRLITAADTTPDPFSFADTVAAFLVPSPTIGQFSPTKFNLLGNSQPLCNFVVSGLGPAGAAISITGNGNPRYGIGFQQITNLPGTVHNGDGIVIYGHTPSSVSGSIAFTTLTIGTFSATWRLITQ